MSESNTHGLTDKYVVAKTDGTPVNGWFFLLRPATDPHAKTALLAYADACERDNPTLASDLRGVVASFEINVTANEVEQVRGLIWGTRFAERFRQWTGR